MQLPDPQAPHRVAGGQVGRGRLLPRERREDMAGPVVPAAGQVPGLGRGRAPHRGDGPPGVCRCEDPRCARVRMAIDKG